jgi:hypothetical protein
MITMITMIIYPSFNNINVRGPSAVALTSLAIHSETTDRQGRGGDISSPAIYVALIMHGPASSMSIAGAPPSKLITIRPLRIRPYIRHLHLQENSKHKRKK